MKKLYVLILILSLLILPNEASAKRLMTTAFEWQSFTDGIELTTNYGGIVETGTVHSGAASMELSGSIASTAAIGGDITMEACTVCYVRHYVNVESLPATNDVAVYMDLYSGATNIISVQFTNNAGTYGVVPYYNNFASNLVSNLSCGLPQKPTHVQEHIYSKIADLV